MFASKTAREARGYLSAGSPAWSHLLPATPGPQAERKPGGERRVSNRKSTVRGEICASPNTPHPGWPSGETSGHQPPFPRAPKPVFQASGACRSDVLTAQVAKATNTRHMSFWLKVNEVRAPRGSPGRKA